jgi:hypothetical protein
MAEDIHLVSAAKKQRRDFVRMLQEVEAETDRDGAVPIDRVLKEIDQIIAASGR